MRMRIIAICCSALLGCTSLDPVVEQFKVPNLFGPAFKDKQDVLDHIPVGTPVEKAQAVMRAHGFEEWSRQRQNDRMILDFHRFDPASLRKPEEDTWITIYFERGTAVDIAVRP